MSQSAEVHSLELLRRLRAALARFGEGGQTALAQADLEIRRVLGALEERLKYWQQQVNRRQEEVNQARAALSHARALREGSSVGCVEQELALRKAQERLREAEAKVVTVRRWQRELPNHIKDLEGPARALAGYLEADLRQSAVLLDNKIATLEAYVSAVEKAGG